MRWIDRLPLKWLALVAAYLAVAPWVPEPHLIEKWRMLLRTVQIAITGMACTYPAWHRQFDGTDLGQIKAFNLMTQQAIHLSQCVDFQGLALSGALVAF